MPDDNDTRAPASATLTADATPQEREQYYDDVLAPMLLEVANLCKAHSMPMVAAVYFHEDFSGVTKSDPAKGVDNPAWWLVFGAWQARGNLDALCMAIVRRVLPENDGTIATKLFRHHDGKRKAAFFRGVADAAEQGS